MYEYQLVYQLKEPMSFSDSHVFGIELKANSMDSVLTLSPRRIHFAITRKHKVTLPEHACNRDRIRILGSTLLLLSATSSLAPSLENEFQIITQDDQSISCPLPEICSSWPSSYAEDLFSIESIPDYFQRSSKGRAIRSSISYLIESRHSRSQAGRRRLLWTAFNALYSHVSQKKRECEKLNDIASLMLKSPDSFESSLTCLQLGLSNNCLNDLPWRSITDKLKTSKPESRGSYIESMDQIIAQAYASHLSNRGKTREIKDLLLSLLGDLDARNNPKALAFLITKYMYSIRNESFHGETPFPVYPQSERKAHDVWIEDLLEATILDLIEIIEKPANPI